MQIGSAATQPLATQARLPASWRAASDTSSPTSSSVESSDTTVTLSADGTRLAAADAEKNASGDPTADGKQPSPQQEQQDRQKLAELSSRDADVRAHEQAHASVGGAYAGSPSYTMQRGPDGKSYAVGGEVGIDVSAVPNDPAATISKMEVVMRAALAPADPSAQDRRVAAEAQGLAAAARAELAKQRRTDAAEQTEEKREAEQADEASSTTDTTQNTNTSASLQVYQSIAAPLDSTPQLVAVA